MRDFFSTEEEEFVCGHIIGDGDDEDEGGPGPYVGDGDGRGGHGRQLTEEVGDAHQLGRHRTII